MILTRIGATYAAQGRQAEALAQYWQALRTDPTYAPAQKAVGHLEGKE